MMLQKTIHKILLMLAGLFLSSFIFHSCIDEKISSNPSLKLSFSKDTLLFDTVFTTIGSSTSKIMVYNPNKENVNISAVWLEKGADSYYHINVDGEQRTNNHFTNVELRAGDSLFIFVEVKVDINSLNQPFEVKDFLNFLTNGNRQQIHLLAYGQNMTVLRNKTIQNDTTLTAEKPYVVYGDLVVDSGATLRIEPGCKFYFHDMESLATVDTLTKKSYYNGKLLHIFKQSSLVVYGNLIAEGKREKPILLRGDRTDKIFEDIPYNLVSNQWGGVLLLSKEGNHSFNFVRMNSGYVGIFFSNSDRNFRPKLKIENSRIHNFLKYGLVAQNGDVLVTNSEISNTGAYSVYLNGGKHRFIHSTIANYFNSTDVRIQPSAKEGNAAVMIMELNRIIPMETEFLNCVVAGSSNSEFEILSRFEQKYYGKFSHSYFKKEKPDPIPTMFSNISWYNPKDTLFQNTFFSLEKLEYYNFMPDSISPIQISLGNFGALSIDQMEQRLEDGSDADARCSRLIKNEVVTQFQILTYSFKTFTTCPTWR